MFSFAINAVAVIVGGSIGLLFRKFIKKEYCDAVLKVMGLAIIVLGVQGAIEYISKVNYGIIATIVCLAIGTFIGEVLKLDTHVNHLTGKIEKKFNKGGLSEGLVTATTMFCVGAMAIIGTLNACLGDPTTIYVKSGIDFVTGIILASTLGFGVVLSFICVFVYQGLLTLLFVIINGMISIETATLFATYISMVGYVIVFGIGVNFFLKEKIKIINLLPSILIAIIYCLVSIWLG